MSNTEEIDNNLPIPVDKEELPETELPPPLENNNIVDEIKMKDTMNEELDNSKEHEINNGTEEEEKKDGKSGGEEDRQMEKPPRKSFKSAKSDISDNSDDKCEEITRSQTLNEDIALMEIDMDMGELFGHLEEKQVVEITKSAVGQRQRSCTVRDIPKEEIPNSLLKIKKEERVRRESVHVFLGKHKENEKVQEAKNKLLGNLDSIAEEKCNSYFLSNSIVAEVLIKKISFICPSRAKGDIVIDFTNYNHKPKEIVEYKLKEKAIYHIRIEFKVNYDIAFGLKYCNIVRKHGFVAGKSEEIIGTYAPTKNSHVVNLQHEETPSGFFSRGKYTGKAMIIDYDGIVHLQYEYILKIGKNWDSGKEKTEKPRKEKKVKETKTSMKMSQKSEKDK